MYVQKTRQHFTLEKQKINKYNETMNANKHTSCLLSQLKSGNDEIVNEVPLHFHGMIEVSILGDLI